jgi:hypothetical protein
MENYGAQWENSMASWEPVAVSARPRFPASTVFQLLARQAVSEVFVSNEKKPIRIPNIIYGELGDVKREINFNM